jgi:hypothetical protein
MRISGFREQPLEGGALLAFADDDELLRRITAWTSVSKPL